MKIQKILIQVFDRSDLILTGVGVFDRILNLAGFDKYEMGYRLIAKVFEVGTVAAQLSLYFFIFPTEILFC
ncbi:unnamed protein product [Lactuca virosa]|uniref:Uncharacterized protein n=1 Tax=Lactuca virosa TaxID=75947 RepID=A0AAU9LNR4_9ASTR|nr:unnamed protein product [Lactuca virosa]